MFHKISDNYFNYAQKFDGKPLPYLLQICTKIRVEVSLTRGQRYPKRGVEEENALVSEGDEREVLWRADAEGGGTSDTGIYVERLPIIIIAAI